MVRTTDKASDEPADQSLCLSFDYSMSNKLLTEHHLEFLSLKGSCTGLSESTLVKMPHCWKSHVKAQFGPVHEISVLIASASSEGLGKCAYAQTQLSLHC